MKQFLLFHGFLILAAFASAQDKNENEKLMNLALDKARQSVREGNFDDAIKQFARCLDLAERDERRHPLTPVLDCLREWHDLAEKHPPAMEALVARRDQDTARILNMAEDKKELNEAIPHRPMVQRVTIMNRHLDQPAKTVELFKAIETKYPLFARFVDEFCHNALIAEGEYDLVWKYLGDPDTGFKAARKKYLERKDREARGKAGIFAGSFERDFASDINRFLKVLYASGQTERADALREKAIEVVDSPTYFVPKEE